MYLSPRHAEIIQMAKDHGRVLVEDLATHFSVTPQTIRKDLNDLCDQRLLTRVHDGALLDFDFREVKVAQAIIANARHVILVSDQTKFERTAPVRIGHLSQVNTFITDRCDIPSVRRICEEREVRLIETALE